MDLDSAQDRRRYGRLAGYLFAFGSLSTLPASLLLEPRPPGEVYLMTIVAVLSGLACLRIPWERVPPRWMAWIPAIGTLEIAIVCGLVDPAYSLLYFVVIVYAALALPTRVELALQLAIAGLALVAPVIYDPDSGREHVRIALLELPVLVIVAGAVRYLKELLEVREAADREFASEAIELAQRIRGPIPGEDRLDELARELEGESR